MDACSHRIKVPRSWYAVARVVCHLGQCKERQLWVDNLECIYYSPSRPLETTQNRPITRRRFPCPS